MSTWNYLLSVKSSHASEVQNTDCTEMNWTEISTDCRLGRKNKAANSQRFFKNNRLQASYIILTKEIIQISTNNTLCWEVTRLWKHNLFVLVYNWKVISCCSTRRSDHGMYRWFRMPKKADAAMLDFRNCCCIKLHTKP